MSCGKRDSRFKFKVETIYISRFQTLQDLQNIMSTQYI